MARKKRESDQRVENRIGDPIPAPGIGSRITAAANLFASRIDAASYCGISSDTLRRWERDETVPSFDGLARLAHGANVSLDWLATGKGPMRGGSTTREDDGDDWGDGSISEELTRYEGELERLNRVPVTSKDIQENQSLADMRKQLQRIVGDPYVFTNLRNRANLILRLAFVDQEAEKRHEEQLHEAFGKVKDAAKVVTDAADILGWRPPSSFREALKSAIIDHQLSPEAVLRLMMAVREDCAPRSDGDKSPYAW